MQPDNCIITIFGASGDLTQRKLLPALFDLHEQRALPESFAVLGVGRTRLSDDDFRKLAGEAIKTHSQHQPLDAGKLREFVRKLHYHSIDSYAGDYSKLKARLAEMATLYNTRGNCIYYLSTPPSVYESIVQGLAIQKLDREDETPGWKRIVVEKPFGRDLETARLLNRKLLAVFAEEQIYRIDHYLGKETVQNLLVFRFANGIFEPLWNRNFIQCVEITAAEDIGVENRGGYYDQTGALRDMVQNHLLQVLALVAMEPPASVASEAVRNETLKVFQSLRPLKGEDVSANVVQGQYMPATIRGEKVAGYREEEGVASDSRTETYLAMRVRIDNWRWGGVPFFIRAGKRLPVRVTEVVVNFKPSPHPLFAGAPGEVSPFNQLVLRIQPDEGVLLKFSMKQPGAGFELKDVAMDFHYSELTDAYIPSAYERLLLDCMLGQPLLYARGDGVEACWEYVTPILAAWDADPAIKLHGYPAGTWGPREADALLAQSGLEWRFPCRNLSNDGLYCEL